jgi:hypothetical protein
MQRTHQEHLVPTETYLFEIPYHSIQYYHHKIVTYSEYPFKTFNQAGSNQSWMYGNTSNDVQSFCNCHCDFAILAISTLTIYGSWKDCKWLRLNGCGWRNKDRYMSNRNDRSSLIKWLRLNGCGGRNKDRYVSNRNDRSSLIKWLRLNVFGWRNKDRYLSNWMIEAASLLPPSLLSLDNPSLPSKSYSVLPNGSERSTSNSSTFGYLNEFDWKYLCYRQDNVYGESSDDVFILTNFSKKSKTEVMYTPSGSNI